MVGLWPALMLAALLAEPPLPAALKEAALSAKDAAAVIKDPAKDATAPAAKKATPAAAVPLVTKKAPPDKKAAPGPPSPAPLCDGDYADTLTPEIASRILDHRGDPFVFAIRNTATYEHVYYGHDGKLRKEYLRSVVHGTGFSLRVVNGETLLVTNEHVASRPEVTDDEHPVDGVPTGSKKVREQLKIVRDESDDYEPGHLALSKVLSDPAADIALLKAKKILPALPYRLGRSSALRPGNLVQVRGFPLGVFAAVNTGKIVNPFTIDSEKSWQHVDFVIDALLSGGNSGSPVFAVSCRTGEPELVGIFHAGYTEAAALNVVVAIDQLREELETLKVPKRDGPKSEITAADRDRIVQQLFAEQTHKLLFPFGARTAQVLLSDPQTLRFALLDEDFPLATREALALVDRADNGFGTLDLIAVGSEGGPLAEVPASALDADTRDHFERLYDALWHQLLAVLDYRVLQARQRTSADAYSDAQGARGRLRKRLQEQKELLGLIFFDTDRAGGAGLRMAASPDAGPAAPPAAPAPVSPAAPLEPASAEVSGPPR